MYRDDLKQLEAEVRELTEKRDAFKFLSEQLEEEAKNLRAELEVARKDHADLVEKVKVFEVSIDEFDSVTDGQNSQLRAAKQRDEVQTKNVEELQSRLGSVVLDRDNLAKELKTSKLEVVVVKAEADEIVAQYKANAKVAQDQSKNIVEHMKWQSRKQALEEVHARGFNLSVEIEDAKVLKADAKKLAYPEEEDSECSIRSGGGEDLENPNDEAGSGQDRAASV
ncbi:tropomyosin-like [Nicotiana sylvestris]|uniref:tropomyosin-like n=1 Tax=Nicotiana sylvestris TaxID=4096 RepID=UPI00388C6575